MVIQHTHAQTHTDEHMHECKNETNFMFSPLCEC